VGIAQIVNESTNQSIFISGSEPIEQSLTIKKKGKKEHKT